MKYATDRSSLRMLGPIVLWATLGIGCGEGRDQATKQKTSSAFDPHQIADDEHQVVSPSLQEQGHLISRWQDDDSGRNPDDWTSHELSQAESQKESEYDWSDFDLSPIPAGRSEEERVHVGPPQAKDSAREDDESSASADAEVLESLHASAESGDLVAQIKLGDKYGSGPE